eukprot:TRINITY_DN1631_c0_g1_i1.p1 TRINITY_DN1631_c0_g1~~TRINITY_DN1631_c0_g1_i1.p1  ORF type:complete len:323 (-),score=64.51 TRINITY_DN1631_c0_g1_i1:232-1200(-)
MGANIDFTQYPQTRSQIDEEQSIGTFVFVMEDPPLGEHKFWHDENAQPVPLNLFQPGQVCSGKVYWKVPTEECDELALPTNLTSDWVELKQKDEWFALDLDDGEYESMNSKDLWQADFFKDEETTRTVNHGDILEFPFKFTVDKRATATVDVSTKQSDSDPVGILLQRTLKLVFSANLDSTSIEASTDLRVRNPPYKPRKEENVSFKKSLPNNQSLSVSVSQVNGACTVHEPVKVHISVDNKTGHPIEGIDFGSSFTIEIETAALQAESEKVHIPTDSKFEREFTLETLRKIPTIRSGSSYSARTTLVIDFCVFYYYFLKYF